MPQKMMMFLDPENAVRCTISIMPIEAHTAEFTSPPRHMTAVELLQLFADIGREDLGRYFQHAMLNGRNAEAFISDREVARLNG